MCFALHTAYMNVISIVNKRKTGPSFCHTAWIIYGRRHKLDKHTDEWVVTPGDRCAPQEDVRNKHIILAAFSQCSAILFRLQCWWRGKTIQAFLSAWRESDKRRESIFTIRICLVPRRMSSRHTIEDTLQLNSLATLWHPPSLTTARSTLQVFQYSGFLVSLWGLSTSKKNPKK